MTTDVMRWLIEARGLGEELLLDMGVKQVDHPQLGPAAAFPYRRKGETYGAKFRTIDKQFRSSHGVTRGLYCEDMIGLRPDLPVVITEGEIDCLSVMQAGFERACSVPDGWNADQSKTDALLAMEAEFRKAPHVIVAGDNDAAGASLPRAVANILKGHDVRAVQWPDGCKDANDVLVRLGQAALVKCLVEAKRVDPEGGIITGFSDLPPLADRRVLRINEYPFTHVIALELGAMSVWTGTPGSGKSTFLTWVADRVTVEENIRCGIMAFETHPHDLRDQVSLMRTGKEFRDLDDAARARMLPDLDRRFRLVHVTLDGETQQNLGWLESQVYTLAVRDQCKLIIIDPWNELEHLPEKGENMTSYINYATKFLRQLAERLDVHIALVAHPRKMPTDGKPRPPNGYDIADSAAFFNKPSLGGTVHLVKFNDDAGVEHEWVELHIWKVRKTRLYRMRPGKTKVRFNAERMTYEAMP